MLNTQCTEELKTKSVFALVQNSSCDFVAQQSTEPEDMDDVFSFREAKKSKKRLFTPEFVGSEEQTVENLLPGLCSMRKKNIVHVSPENSMKDAQSRKKDADDVFFRFRRSMLKQQAQDTPTTSSESNSPELKCNVGLSRSRKWNNFNSLPIDEFLFEGLAEAEVIPVNRYSHNDERNKELMSTQNKIGQSHTLLVQQNLLQNVNMDNLLEFGFRCEPDSQLINEQPSIEDDVVTTLTRRKEFVRNPTQQWECFKIELFSMQSEVESQSTHRSVVLKHSISEPDHNLLDFETPTILYRNKSDALIRESICGLEVANITSQHLSGCLAQNMPNRTKVYFSYVKQFGGLNGDAQSDIKETGYPFEIGQKL